MTADATPEDRSLRHTEAPASGPTGAAADDPAFDRVTFLWNQQRYILENIKLADTKAGFVMTFAAALLSAGLSPGGRVSLNLAHHASAAHGIAGPGLAVAAICALAASALCSAWSIKPRLFSKGKPSPVSWVSVARYPNVESFVQVSSTLDRETSAHYLSEQVYYMSCICLTKHGLISRSILFSLLGGISMAMSIIVG